MRRATFAAAMPASGGIAETTEDIDGNVLIRQATF